MSIEVDVTKLDDEMQRFGAQAYLLSVSDDATAHVAHLTFALSGDALRCGVSRTAARNVKSRPRISVLWPPYEPGGYSMIVDGDCELSSGTAADGADELAIRPVTGVLHRPAAPAESADNTAEDCGCGPNCCPIGG